MKFYPADPDGPAGKFLQYYGTLADNVTVAGDPWASTWVVVTATDPAEVEPEEPEYWTFTAEEPPAVTVPE
ncbi:MAG: hypothetical protein IFK93_05150, partial [Acidobacteria bacterium]|nr:hypothetical protein [Candidatus Sulfomarinibacter kjeldsenii]